MSTATLTRPTRPAGRDPRAVERRQQRAARRAVPVERRAGGRARQAPTSPVRLTRRGRALVVLVLAAVLLTVFTITRTSSSVAGGEAALPTPLGVTTVASGETLWGVARRIAPDADVRQLVEQIRELNRMGDATLQAGQQLLLPVEA